MGSPPPAINGQHVGGIIILFSGCMFFLYAVTVYAFGEFTFIDRCSRNMTSVEREKNPILFRFLLSLTILSGVILFFGGIFMLIFA